MMCQTIHLCEDGTLMIGPVHLTKGYAWEETKKKGAKEEIPLKRALVNNVLAHAYVSAVHANLWFFEDVRGMNL
jgi:hypothetical protein